MFEVKNGKLYKNVKMYSNISICLFEGKFTTIKIQNQDIDWKSRRMNRRSFWSERSCFLASQEQVTERYLFCD